MPPVSWSEQFEAFPLLLKWIIISYLESMYHLIYAYRYSVSVLTLSILDAKAQDSTSSTSKGWDYAGTIILDIYYTIILY